MPMGRPDGSGTSGAGAGAVAGRRDVRAAAANGRDRRTVAGEPEVDPGLAAGLDPWRQPGAGLPGRCASCATPGSTGSPTSWTGARAAQVWADWTSDQRWTL